MMKYMFSAMGLMIYVADTTNLSLYSLRKTTLLIDAFHCVTVY